MKSGPLPQSLTGSRPRSDQLASWSFTNISCARNGQRRAPSCRSLQTDDRKSKDWQATILTETTAKAQKTYTFSSNGQLILQEATNGREQSGNNVLTGLKGFALPKGYPETVTPDYLPFQLWAIPAHITGWMGTSLATSSLLKAVGVANSAEGVAAASAAIKWITKDGIGAAGRSLVGGRLGDVFDEDPRRWRMVAEAFLTVGLALEIATAFSPNNFVLLAGAGNLSRAAGRGMTNPCFRIIQTHFAAANNIGDVAAKEEVWEVSAQLIGLAGSVGLLKAIEATGRPENVVYVWAVNQVAHAWLRYKSLAVLQFANINQKRACLLARASVTGQALPGVQEGNKQESVLAWPAQARPSLTFATSLEDIFSAASSSSAAQEYLDMYADRQYLLTWQSSRCKIMLAADASPVDVLLAVWQAAWLDHRGVVDATQRDLQASIDAVSNEGAAYIQDLRNAGWQVEMVTIRTGQVRFRRQ